MKPFPAITPKLQAVCRHQEEPWNRETESLSGEHTHRLHSSSFLKVTPKKGTTMEPMGSEFDLGCRDGS